RRLRGGHRAAGRRPAHRGAGVPALDRVGAGRRRAAAPAARAARRPAGAGRHAVADGPAGDGRGRGRRGRHGELRARAGDRRLAPRPAGGEALPLVIPTPLKIGIGGPVGSGKTALVEALCRRLRDRLEMAVITNDIYTREDAEFLVRRGALAADRVVGVETGGCPHTAIREDASVNLDAIRGL